jgi:hypothetical protein
MRNAIPLLTEDVAPLRQRIQHVDDGRRRLRRQRL